jgi:cytochrome-b5 reductase
MSKELFPSTASATGNPRNKTALKPGFSLMGWIRLTNSGEDLTGFKGKIVNVSHQELAKHNKFDDCWMAVRGKVYNVTKYLDFHPGGAEQLMRGKKFKQKIIEYKNWQCIGTYQYKYIFK